MEDFERKFAVNPGDEAAGRPKELVEADIAQRSQLGA
jgi:hypothetical protein